MTKLITLPNKLELKTFRITSFKEAGSKGQIAKVVLIEAGPGNLGDRHYYMEEALQDAVDKKYFEGKQCYGDHPTSTEEKIQPERSVRQLMGFFQDISLESIPSLEDVPGYPKGSPRPAVVGSFVPEPIDWVLAKLQTAQRFHEKFPDLEGYIGWSIVAGGQSQAGLVDTLPFNIVKQFQMIDSVDMVTRPGAGGRLLQYMEADSMKLPSFLRPQKREKVREAQSALRTKLTEGVVAGLREQKIPVTTTQIKILETGVRTLPKFLATAGFVHTLIKEAGIQLTPEQDQGLDKALGLVDGGPLDALLDQITGVPGSSAPDDDDAPGEEEDGLEVDENSDDNNDEEDDADAADASLNDAGQSDEETDEDEAGFGGGPAPRPISSAPGLPRRPPPKYPPSQLQRQSQTKQIITNLKEKNKDLEQKIEGLRSNLRAMKASVLLEKSTLPKEHKVLIYEALARLPVKLQREKLVTYEAAFGTKTVIGGAPANSLVRESAGGVRKITAVER